MGQCYPRLDQCGAAVVRKCLESVVLKSTSSHCLPSTSERNHSLTAQLSPDVFCVGEKKCQRQYIDNLTLSRKRKGINYLLFIFLISVYHKTVCLKMPVQKVR